MSRFLFTLCSLFCITAIHAQTTTSISSGTNVVNTGSTYNVPAGFFVNNGSYTDTTSPGAFNVNGGVAFSGTGTTTVYNFNFNAGSSVLNALVTAYGTVTIGAGDTLDANNNLVLHPGASIVDDGVLSNIVMGIVLSASQTSSCSSFTPTLSQNISGSEVLYQWQSSPDSAAWTNISGATNAAYSPTVTSTSYYRSTVSTSNTAFTDTTAGVKLILLYAPSVITGTASVCMGATTTLSDAITGGIWSSATGSIATIGSSSGAVTPVSPGTTLITYSTGCAPDATVTATVNALPIPTFAIAPDANTCSGVNTTYTTQAGETSYSWAVSGFPGIDYTIISGGIDTGSNTVTLQWTTAGSKTVTVNYTDANGCPGAGPATDTTTVTLPPAAITASNVCLGSTATESDATGGGTWSAGNGNVTIDSLSGVVTGVTAGTSIISYTLLTACAPATAIITVNPLPTDIGGAVPVVCMGASIALTDAGGGSWASSDNTIATVDGSGNVYGIAAGTSTITYTLPTGCISTMVITVNTTPAPIDGTLSICSGATTTLGDITGYGAWTSSNTAVATFGAGSAGIGTIVGIGISPAGVWVDDSGNIYACNYGGGNILKYTPGSTTGTVVGVGVSNPSGIYVDGSGKIYVADPGNNRIVSFLPGSTAGTTVISGISGVKGVFLDASGNIYVPDETNERVLEFPPSGIGSGITVAGGNGYGGAENQLSGDLWGVRVDASGDIYVSDMDNGRVQKWAPGAITGTTVATGLGSPMCIALDASNNLYVSDFNNNRILEWIPGATSGIVVANASLPCGVFVVPAGNIYVGVYGSGYVEEFPPYNNSGDITGGTTIDTSTITYTLYDGCTATAVVTVNSLPGIIGGTAQTCTGLTATLTEATTDGTWSSNNTTIATISGAGVVGGITAGTVNITYTSPAGCIETTVFTVNQTPAAITGADSVCSGAMTPLADATSGGTWSSSSLSVASVGSTGIVTGGANPGGLVNISYSMPTGCTVTLPFTVNPTPGIISGTNQVCAGLTTVLTEGDTGGAWSSSNATLASVVAGTVTGAAAGTLNIVYTLPAGSCAATYPITVNALPAAITGTTSVCQGLTTLLEDGTSGGTWASSLTDTATVGLTTGIVTGVAGPGTTTITYTAANTCITTAIVTVNPLPDNSFTVAGGAAYCSGSTAPDITLSGSTDLPVTTYQLFNGATATGGAITGTGEILNFGAQAAAGTYTVAATITATGCTAEMTGSTTVTVNPLAIEYTVTGSGSICPEGPGIVIGVSNSQAGVSYQLMNGVTPIGSAVSSIGGAISFPALTTAGTYFVIATTPESCQDTMSGSATITANPAPTAFAVTGTGSYCAGSAGVSVGLDGSQAGVNYQLFNGGAIGSPVAGTGSAISFGVETAGTYTVVATNAATGCTADMTGSAIVSVNPLPAVYAVSGGGSYCTGGDTVKLSGSELDVNYQLYNGATMVGSPLSGTGDPLNFLSVTSAGALTVVATNLASFCTSTMSGSATVTALPLPIVHNVTGGGNYCLGGTGSHIFLDFSNIGITYQLYFDGTPIGSVAAGAASGLDFGAQTGIGTYTITGINAITGCTVNMAGSASVSVNALPALDTVTGGGGYCTGGTGVDIGLNGSAAGVNYQLINGAILTGAALPGTGSALDFGLKTTAGTYIVTATSTSTGCMDTMANNAIVVVNTPPAAITGTVNVCPGNTTLLSDATTGGTWSSNSAIVATVDSTAGVVLGVASGSAIITYALPTTCFSITTVSVNSTPPAISGNTDVCMNTTSDLTDLTGGGTWSSGTPSVATVDPVTGTVFGVAGPGTSLITYTVGIGCETTATVTVNTLPADISGTLNVCTGSTTALTDVNTGGGWGSSNTLVATVDPSLGTVAGVSAGTSNITYTLPTGCITVSVVTVNTTPGAISGTDALCSGASFTFSDGTSGGTWSTSDAAIATVSSPLSGVVTGFGAGTVNIIYTMGTGCAASRPLTVNPQPAAFSGAAVCTGFTTTLSETTTGGTWASSNTAQATIGESTDTIGGVTAGMPIITYTLPTGCFITAPVTVNPTPAAITGVTNVCSETTITLGDATSGGSWSSSNASIATAGSGTGLITGGISTGPVTILYTMPSGCFTTLQITVNPSPDGIGGSSSVCTGSTITLTDASTGGVWGSSNTAQATVDSTGIVGGIVAGSPIISYSLGTCSATATIAVNQTPPAITGIAQVCTGVNTLLADATSGGTWTSSDGTLATVGIISGNVGGKAQGLPVIDYIMPTGCFASVIVTVNPSPLPITGAPAVCTGTTTTLTEITTGGTWSSSNTSQATVDALTGIVGGIAAGTPNINYTVATGCFAAYPIVDNISPAPIGGNPQLCFGVSSSLTDGSGSGLWSSDDNTIATVIPVSGFVTGAATGSTTISYTLANGCVATLPVTVNTQPAPLAFSSGGPTICAGANLPLIDDSTGGIWTSSNTGIATTTGSVSGAGTIFGVAPGIVDINYTLSPGGCTSSLQVTVNPQPDAISGPDNVCLNSMASLGDASPGGTWSSSITTIATVDSTGSVTGVLPGTDSIYYVLPAGCSAALPITVNPLPSSFTGSLVVCVGSTTTLNSTPAGAWGSSDTAVATIGSTGIVTGVDSGITTITYTLPTGCLITAQVTVNALPAIFTVTGGGAYCAGGVGLHVFLDGSAAGISYQLYDSTVTDGSALAGTGSSLDFGLHTAAGARQVIATNTVTGCLDTMASTAIVVVNPLPTTYYITGGGSYCAGSAGLPIGLFSSEPGIRYQLYKGASVIGSPVNGTGAAISFGLETLAGVYTVVATDTLSACTNNMSGSVAITITPLPTVHSVTGGGSYCSAGAGVHIGLDGSDVGVNYQLYNGATADTIVAGTGSPIDFGLITAVSAPSYTVVAFNPSSTCTVNMLGSVTVSVNALPATVGVLGGGAYCSGGAGATVTLSNSTIGVNYQFYIGTTPIGGLLAGTGSAIVTTEFVPGTYTATATSTTTGCTSTMTGSATITINPLPVAFTVTGGGAFCGPVDAAGVSVGTSGSATGVSYALILNGTTTLGSLAGTGSPLTSPGALVLGAGVYTVIGTVTATGCANPMTGSVTIASNPLPTQYTVTGGGGYCAGGPGSDIGLSNSDITNTYQLYRGGTTLVGSAITGTGAALDFGLQTAAGTYTIVATNSTTSCTNTMTASVGVTINPVPAVNIVTGGGSYCAGGTGVHVGLNGSVTGLSYQLYNGAAPIDTPMTGGGTTIDFGLLTSAGNYTVVAKNTTTGCTSAMTSSALVVINPLPTVYNVTGGGSYCAGGTGVHIGLNATTSGSTYQLFLGSTPVGSPVTGTGSLLDFGLITPVGTYSVVATTAGTLCTSNMAGSAVVGTNPLPASFTVTGGGSYCTGGAGLNVGLSGSTTGISYQLLIGGIPSGLPVAGTGSSLDFGLQTVAGVYTISAAATATTCSANMTGSVSISINPLPAIYTVTGGGSYCVGGTGADVGLSGSNTSINYQLYNGAVPAGSLMAGTGSALDFGLQTGTGVYTVIATSAISSCTIAMSSSVPVNNTPLPTAYVVSGGGSFCPGGAGVHVMMSGSDTGVRYQLFNTGLTIGAPVTGTGSALDFGLQTGTGTYTVVATNIAAGCVKNMTGSATISLSPLPDIYSVMGGGSYCSGVGGVDVSLSNSASGINYQLYLGASPIGGPVAGSGAPVDFGLETAAGVYTAVAYNATTSCSVNMTGDAPVTIIALPTVFNVTGGGGYCIGGAGADVALSGSAAGVNYQLYRGASPIGGTLPGTGDALDFGLQVVAGTYTVVAENAIAGCQSNMALSAVVSINPLPGDFAVTGGGSYCIGGAGVHIGLSGSAMGITYQLFNSSMVAVGSPLAGTGTALDYGIFTAAGVYTVVATNTATHCTGNMSSSASVIINPLPTVHTVTGGGSYCASGIGLHIYLDGSDSGVNYQLSRGLTTIGGSMAGAGSSLDFGLQTVAGNYTVVAVNAATGCTVNMADSAAIAINALPTAYTVTGGGSYCAGGVGALISIAGTQTGVDYQIYHGSFTAGTPQAGTGFALGLGFETIPGAYTVLATNTINGCTNNMPGILSVSVNPVPALYTVTGGGSYCTGTEAPHITIGGTDAGVNYQLLNGGVPVGSVVAGTGSAFDFGPQSAAGTYTISAVNATTGCNSNMPGSATVAVNPLPVVYTVSGGGSYCAGGTGETVSMSGSDTGISYQLYIGTAATGSPLAGTGGAISFGLQAAAGTYTVVAANATSACTKNMAGSAIITVNSLPSVYPVIGGGSYCVGGSGFHIGLSNSNAGIQYQLLKDGVPVSGTVAGTGSALDFGLENAAGTYTVTAAKATTGCGSTMAGSAAIAVNPLPTAYTVTGGGNYCIGSGGVHVGLAGSDSTVNYQLYNGATAVGVLVTGTNLTLDFGLQTAGGAYTVVAENITTACTDTMTGSTTVTAIPTVTPSVSLASGMGDTLCSGTSSSFTASVVNGGATPTYAWYVNSVPTVTTGSILTYAPANGDIVSVTVTSSAACSSPATATSSVTMSVLPNLAPSVSIIATPGDTVCQGSGVTYIASPVNGGTAPVYVWTVNGATIAGIGTGGTYNYTPANGDVVFCVMGSNYRCRADTFALSNTIAMTVESTTLPVVSIAVTEGKVVNGEAYNDTLTAVVTNGGFAPTYQWSVNAVDVPGATMPVFTADSIAVNAVVSCTVVNRNACGTLPASGQTLITLGTTGVQTIANVSDIRLAPNPNKGIFAIKGTLGTLSDEEVSLEITDMLGQVIYRNKVTAHNGTINETIQLGANIANGMYLLNLRSGVQSMVFHMVVEQ